MALSARWKDHIEAWQASGLSQAAYCRQHGLNVNTFSGRLSDYLSRALPGQPEALIPIQVRPGSTTAEVPMEPIVLRHGKGHRLELPVTVSPRWLAELLQCLG